MRIRDLDPGLGKVPDDAQTDIAGRAETLVHCLGPDGRLDRATGIIHRRKQDGDFFFPVSLTLIDDCRLRKDSFLNDLDRTF